MNISIKNHIINNFKNASKKDIKQAIVASSNDLDEITLPGLGVFFNLLWEQSNEEEKEKILNKLKDSLKTIQ
ncbi:MAG: small acid-soluble spore protein SspI [Bacilli bacterium]|nr:small acid-soluble spore protein SspI [Bacilli bacterium]